MALMNTLLSAPAKTSVKKHLYTACLQPFTDTSSGICVNVGALSDLSEQCVPPYQYEQEEQYKATINQCMLLLK